MQTVPVNSGTIRPLSNEKEEQVHLYNNFSDDHACSSLSKAPIAWVVSTRACCVEVHHAMAWHINKERPSPKFQNISVANRLVGAFLVSEVPPDCRVHGSAKGGRTSDSGAASIADCYCPRDYFLYGDHCMQCPQA
eukprot:4765406-Amphidinium_carterae.2